MNHYKVMDNFIEYVKLVLPGVEISLHPDRNSRIYTHNNETAEIADEDVMRAIDGGFAESYTARVVNSLDYLEYVIKSFVEVPDLGSPAHVAKTSISC